MEAQVPSPQHRVFNPQLADSMGDAFRAAWDMLVGSGSVYAQPFRAEWTRETLARRIIEMARGGERDVDRLRDDAVAYLGEAARKDPA